MPSTFTCRYIAVLSNAALPCSFGGGEFSGVPSEQRSQESRTSWHVAPACTTGAMRNRSARQYIWHPGATLFSMQHSWRLFTICRQCIYIYIYIYIIYIYIYIYGRHPPPGRAASHSLVCEQMDVVTVDAFAAFIIVYTLFILVVLPIKSFLKPLVFTCVASDKLVASFTPFPVLPG